MLELVRGAIKRAVEAEQYSDHCSSLRKDVGGKRAHIRERGDGKNCAVNEPAQHVAPDHAQRERCRQYRYCLCECIEQKGADDRVNKRGFNVRKVEKKNDPHECTYCRICKAHKKTMQDECKGGIARLNDVRHVMRVGSGACLVCGARIGIARSRR